jgi:multidrug efflux pump
MSGQHSDSTPSDSETSRLWIDYFLRDRRLLMLAIGLILVSGLSSLMVMPRMEDPLLAPRAASITTLLPGADANLVESLVTEKIEDEIKKIKEVKEVRSASRLGVSLVQIELLDSVTGGEAPAVWSRIRGKIDDAQVFLPGNASRPEFELIDVKAYAVLAAVRWTSPQPVNPAILRRLARSLEEKLRSVPGTELVDTFGDPAEEIRVTLDAEAAVSLGLTAAEVSSQIKGSDAKVSAGQIRSALGEVLLEVTESLDTLTQLGQIPIRLNQEGIAVQLSDIAQIEKGNLDPPHSLALIRGNRAIVLGALVRDDKRVDQWIESVIPLIDQFRQSLPAGIEVEIIFNQASYVRKRLSNLSQSLGWGALGVLLVILLMMGWRSALIVGSALPLASLMVLACLRVLDIPIHQMSITGLIVALGLLIDNAIVIVDEVAQEIRDGNSPRRAARRAVKVLGVPLLGSTLTTALAFGPIALMPGPAGEFVGAIAISVILAVFSSFILAMTLLPALAMLGIRPGPGSSTWWGSGFSSPWLRKKWSRFLEWILQRPWLGIGIGLLLPVLGFVGASRLSEQFFPAADRDQLHIEVELGAGASLAETLSVVEQIRGELLQQPAVQDVHWFVGESAPMFYYNLIPTRKNVPRYAQAIVQKNSIADQNFVNGLQAELDQKFPQALILVRLLEQGPPFYAPIELRLFGSDIEILQELGDQLRLVLAAVPGIVATRSELSESLPKINFDIDETQTKILGLDPSQIAGQLSGVLEGVAGGSVLEGTEELPIRVQISNLERGDLNRISTLYLLNPTSGQFNNQSPTLAGKGSSVSGGQTGRMSDVDFRGIPLSSVTSMKLVSEPAGIPRLNNQRMNEIQAFIQAGTLTAEVLNQFQDRLAQSEFRLPPGYRLEYGGEASKRNDAIGNLMANVGVLAVLMVATLVLSFQSFRLAALIGVVAVLAVGLGMGALWLYGFPFGFMAIIGTMGLIGVAINDSIVVLAAIRADQSARAGERRAIRDVVIRSSRHIIATTLTTTVGFLPLILAGGGFWPPLAVAVSGGIVGATILALVFIPAAYAVTHPQRRESSAALIIEPDSG